GSKSVQEKFETLLPKIPDTTVAVVYEPGIPDRRTALFKLFKKSATSQEFEPLVGTQLNRWIDQLLRPYEATIAPNAREQLLELTGTDSWRLASELTKLGTSLLDKPVGERQISAELVTSIITGSPEVSVFALTDAILSGKEEQVVKQLRLVVAQGENEQYLIAMVGSTFRSLALIRDGLDQGATNSNALATITGLKPFVIGKQLATAKRVTLPQLAGLYCQLVKLDAGLKNGTMMSEVGLELLLLRTATQFAGR
ncbi:MAG: DNA polymerase III subunit delta, partial [Patescibacteria group bacterium]